MKLVLVLIISLAVGCLRPFTVTACSPAAPTPWFTEQITVSTMPLPDGVTVGVIEGYLAVGNSSPTPLYVLGLPYFGHSTFETLPVQPPGQLAPLHKIVTNQVFTWRQPYDGQLQLSTSIWEAEARILRLGVTMPPAYPDGTGSISSSGGKIVSLEPRNRVGDKRPPDMPLPAPQQAHLYLAYDNALLQVPITISYALNPNYDPESVKRAENACSQFDPYLMRILLLYSMPIILVLAAGLGVWWVWRRSSRYGKKTPGAHG